MPSATFFGVSHVDVLVTDVERSLRIYAHATGFPVRARGEGFADVDAGGVILYILASPKVTRGRNRQPLLDHGIDVDRYQADWDAD